jgi:hypothetical protein
MSTTLEQRVQILEDIQAITDEAGRIWQMISSLQSIQEK